MKLKAALLIFFATLIVYSNSLGGEFAWDDEYFVVKNSRIRTLDGIASFFTNPSTAAFGGLAKDIYRPITVLSYALNYRFSGLDAFGYHLINVLIHSFNAILLFLLLYYLFNDLSIAFFASLLFACHPVQTEVVSWISGRSSILALFFYLISLICYVKRYRIFSIFAFALALFSKEMAVTLPLVLILYDIHFGEKTKWKNKAFGYLPYFILTALFIIARSVLLNKVSQTGWWGGSPYHTFLTMSKVMVSYLKILAAPIKLCAFYSIRPSQSITAAGVAPSVGILILIFGALPFIYRRSKELSFAVLWFFVTILPVSNIVPLKALMAERFLYIPSIGLILAAVLIIKRLSKKTVVAALVASTLVAAYSLRTIARNEDWKDAVHISESIVKIDPMNSWGLTSLGSAQMEKGDYENALRSLKKAVAVSPDYSSARNALGFYYLERGSYADAAGEFEAGIKLDPDDAEMPNSLGIAYANLKKYEDAEKQFKAALEKSPAFVTAYLNLGALYETKKEYEKALAEYNKVLSKTKTRSESAFAHIRIGDVYKKTGQTERAKEFYRKVVKVCGDDLHEAKKAAEERLNGVK